jgi:hypothetical protein
MRVVPVDDHERAHVEVLLAAGLLPKSMEIDLGGQLAQDFATRFLQQEPTPDLLRQAITDSKTPRTCTVFQLLGGLANVAQNGCISQLVNQALVERQARDKGLGVETTSFLPAIGIAYEAAVRNLIRQDGDRVEVCIN